MNVFKNWWTWKYCRLRRHKLVREFEGINCIFGTHEFCRICDAWMKVRSKENVDMPCSCKNPDGTLAVTCNGTCSQKSFVEQTAVEMRNERSIESRFEYLLSMFLNKLDYKIKELAELNMSKYREGYKDGFTDGRDS